MDALSGGRSAHTAEPATVHVYGYSMARCSRTLTEMYLLVQVDALGGGRIAHGAEAATVHVYGYSSVFGPAPHEVSAALLRRWLPLHTVTTSYEGY